MCKSKPPTNLGTVRASVPARAILTKVKRDGCAKNPQHSRLVRGPRGSSLFGASGPTIDARVVLWVVNVENCG